MLLVFLNTDTTALCSHMHTSRIVLIMKRKCSDLKCVRKPTRSRLSLTHHANKSTRLGTPRSINRYKGEAATAPERVVIEASCRVLWRWWGQDFIIPLKVWRGWKDCILHSVLFLSDRGSIRSLISDYYPRIWLVKGSVTAVVSSATVWTLLS